MTEETASAAASTNAHRVLLLMEAGEDRRLLGTWLATQYAITAASDPEHVDEEFDLCLLDEATFSRYTDALIDWKADRAPTFLPYLLVLEEETTSSVDQRVWEHVDELISTPVEKAELQGRLRGLLVRRDLSKALSEREERIRQILQTIPDPLLIVDQTGTVVETNSALAEYTGCETAEGTPLRAIEALPPETATALERLATGAADSLAEATPESRSRDGDGVSIRGTTVTYRSEDGTIRYAEVGVATLAETQTTEQQTLFILRDVTDRITREGALERERDRLDEFADMLAHEVRNPLNIAQGFLDEIRPESERGATAIERVAASHTRMEQMIKELLTHARGDLTSELQAVTLAQIARVAWGQTPTAEATLEIVDEDLTIEADPEHFQTILENLFRNAVDHGGSDATVRVGPLDGGGFYVADDGPGIPPADRERVLERGYTTESAGTGLGLALVQEVSEAHGWTVRVTESSEGGARFEFHDRPADGNVESENGDGSNGGERTDEGGRDGERYSDASAADSPE